MARWRCDAPRQTAQTRPGGEAALSSAVCTCVEPSTSGGARTLCRSRTCGSGSGPTCPPHDPVAVCLRVSLSAHGRPRTARDSRILSTPIDRARRHGSRATPVCGCALKNEQPPKSPRGTHTEKTQKYCVCRAAQRFIYLPCVRQSLCDRISSYDPRLPYPSRPLTARCYGHQYRSSCLYAPESDGGYSSLPGISLLAIALAAIAFACAFICAASSLAAWACAACAASAFIAAVAAVSNHVCTF